MLCACTGATSPGQLAGKPTGAPVVEIAVGRQHSCARRADGSVWCWGNNGSGQVGTGDKRNHFMATRVLGIEDATHLALGDDFSCALLSGATVWCWGYNGNGQLGGGPGTLQRLAEPVPHLAGVVQIAASQDRLCAASSDGSVQCRGGYLPTSPSEGYGVDWCADTDCRANVPEVVHPVQINGLARHFCAVLPDTAIRCFYFELAKEHQSPKVEPALDFVGATSVAANGQGGCAVLQGGSVRCWQGGSTRSSVIADLPAATAVASGSEHTCALLADSTVQC